MTDRRPTSSFYIPLPPGGCVFCRRAVLTVATIIGAERVHVCEPCATIALPKDHKTSTLHRLKRATVERQNAGRAA